MRVLVTGGAGFIGHHLVRALLERGDEVAVIDDLSTGHRARLAPMADRIQFVEGSILDNGFLDASMLGRDVVFHQAALASVAGSLVDPLQTDAVNVRGTIRVMLAAARHDVRRVILAGSSAVYGTPAALPCTESMRLQPESPYGVSKLAAEHYVHTLGKHFGIDTVVLRYFNIFGPGQDPKSDYAAVVPLFATAVLRGERPTINGSGDISRDFLHVDNVVRANLLAADAGPTSLTCNVASGERNTLLDLLHAICRATGRSVEPVVGPARSGDIRHSLADISTARMKLDYEVVVPFDEGIARTVEWFRGQLLQDA